MHIIVILRVALSDTLTELCKKHGKERPADTRGQRFENFGGFVATYMAACECLRDEDDIFRLVREVAEDAKAWGASWIEVGLSMCLYYERFGGMKECLKLLLRAAAAAETSTGVGIGMIVSAERMQDFFPMAVSDELAKTVAELVAEGEAGINGHAGIVGFGLHGDESNNPPEPFKGCFEVACAGCYKNIDFTCKDQIDFRVAALPHAGELHPAPGKGADSVRYCVEELGAKRIAHGVLAATDKDLIALLVEKGVCLDVCPSSNFLLSVVTELSSTAHPLKELLAAGVICTINSDDPLLFGKFVFFDMFGLNCSRHLSLEYISIARWNTVFNVTLLLFGRF